MKYSIGSTGMLYKEETNQQNCINLYSEEESYSSSLKLPLANSQTYDIIDDRTYNGDEKMSIVGIIKTREGFIGFGDGKLKNY